MRSGYTAVVVPATIGEVSALLRDGRPGSHVVELAHGVIALETGEGQHDPGAYQLLAAKAAELFGSAVLAVCALSHARQSALVFRRGKTPQLLLSAIAGPRETVTELPDPIDESQAAEPLADGLALAGLKGRELAALLCKQLGNHEHGARQAADA
jgi:hypothetical protein